MKIVVLSDSQHRLVFQVSDWGWRGRFSYFPYEYVQMWSVAYLKIFPALTLPLLDHFFQHNFHIQVSTPSGSCFMTLSIK